MDPSVLDLARIASAMEQGWRDAEIRPKLGLERASVLDGDLRIEHWSTATPMLHVITIRGPALLSACANDPDQWSEGGDPNAEIASGLLMSIEEALESGPPLPSAFVFDPEHRTISN